MPSPSAAALPRSKPASENSLERAPISARVASVDFVRGLAVVFMALDHVRDFLCNIPFEPENIDQTWGFYFLVRWVTHFCAPAFFLLAGVGAYLYGQKHSTPALQKFLLTRGAWLILLEFTVIGFAWTFHPGWGMFGVICCLGCSMILLAALVRLPRPALMTLALLVIATHDLFDRLKPADFASAKWLLFVLHRSGGAHFGDHTLFVLFPLIPWCAVTWLGFTLGPLFDRASKETQKAKSAQRALLWSGAAAIALFALLRATNLYGNPPAGIAHATPGDWHWMPTLSKTAILFLDVEKYPPSLQYLLMTLGPILILLALGGAAWWGRVGRAFATFGSVPLFFYILHLFTIHLAAIAIGLAWHQPVDWLFHGGFFLNYPPDGWGHGIEFVCLTWVAIIVLLYWPCAWFAGVKKARPQSLLRFL